MQQSVNAINVALRVLTAVNEKRPPDSADIDELRRLAGRGHDQDEADALACDVIRVAIKQRKQVRGTLGEAAH